MAKELVEKAVSLGMRSFGMRVLRAQVYRELCYRFGNDQSWQFSAKQVAERRALFNGYKELANRYYDELVGLDKGNAYDYERLKVKGDYPVR